MFYTKKFHIVFNDVMSTYKIVKEIHNTDNPLDIDYIVLDKEAKTIKEARQIVKDRKAKLYPVGKPIFQLVETSEAR